MLRITRDDTGDTVRLVLEGDLKGAWVAELERFYEEERRRPAKPIAVDLKDLTSVDAAGRYLLALIERDGVNFENVSPLAHTLLRKRRETEPVKEVLP